MMDPETLVVPRGRVRDGNPSNHQNTFCLCGFVSYLQTISRHMLRFQMKFLRGILVIFKCRKTHGHQNKHFTGRQFEFLATNLDLNSACSRIPFTIFFRERVSFISLAFKSLASDFIGSAPASIPKAACRPRALSLEQKLGGGF